MLYRIDAADCLTVVNFTWMMHAKEQKADELLPERVLGRKLWDFVHDAMVREIYSCLVSHVRAGRPVHFLYRCDTATKRRTFRMSIALLPDGEVEFSSVPVAEEARPSVSLLECEAPRDEARELGMCSWCQRVLLPDGFWHSMEAAVQSTDLLRATPLPRLAHTICPECTARMQAQLGV
ncbi:hypothetical protein Verru16b_00374 [Lacunisphaera limnophila]|uniref:PAS fold protein n=1 Tax=Lacunisphaera limnophila TaxID=1838286 RepID=A0A1D8AR22_9BACT|nr:hypothetical protein Verru16b_00374 [Lacunisphaera limnophila]